MMGKRVQCFVALVVLSLNTTVSFGAEPFQQWALATAANIRAHYAAPGNLFTQQPDSTKPSDIWASGVQLSALNAVGALEKSEISRAVAYADGLDAHYRFDSRGVVGYTPRPHGGERYYDDNEWIVLDLVETYELTHEQRFLRRAEDIMRFVASGESADLGGGIFWREIRRDSKNTCSNAPAICCALRLYRYDHDPKLLALAQRLYAWTNAHFQDADGLYWDNIKLDGRVEKTKYSYNSALMLRANCLFYELTREAKYLHEAQRIAQSAEKYWIRPSDGAIMDASQFAHLLSESFLYLTRIDHQKERLKMVERALRYVHDQLPNSEGLYPARWDKRAGANNHDWNLMFQASAVRGYAMAETIF
ncbi:MAG TPA: glycoside hydrolase family 76 protein [Tepidisphaeraceae bacterium]|jgi:hypothetical protein